MKKLLNISAAVLLFICLVLHPDDASGAVRDAVIMCGKVMIPSLLPFFVAANLLNALGASTVTANALAPLAARLFGVSGYGAAAFIVGLAGGYPLGAEYIADLRRRGLISRDEASRLLIFCNNSGPAFIIGAAGAGAFSSAAAGAFLYAVHILSAMLCGMILRRGSAGDIAYSEPMLPDVSFSEALDDSVRRAAGSILNVCAFICAFSALAGLCREPLNALSLALAHLTGADISWCRALLLGLIELGNGIGALGGMAATPLNLALAAFILSFGGLSVHFQTFAAVSHTDIKTARYMIGRLVIAIIAFSLALISAPLVF